MIFLFQVLMYGAWNAVSLKSYISNTNKNHPGFISEISSCDLNNYMLIQLCLFWYWINKLEMWDVEQALLL